MASGWLQIGGGKCSALGNAGKLPSPLSVSQRTAVFELIYVACFPSHTGSASADAEWPGSLKPEVRKILHIEWEPSS